MTRQPTKNDCSSSNASNLMSSQAGVFYFDLRPVPLRVEQELFNALGPTDTDARGNHVAHGLVLAHAATWIDNVAANERQPHTSSLGNTITFDGRLDNRPDLFRHTARQFARRTNRLAPWHCLPMSLGCGWPGQSRRRLEHRRPRTCDA